ncbi:protein FlhE [Kushneria avicenniae]|uniref:Protein FlhE n=1 Tax=Kushneria avicenniae TaxID=402385 RepID=A0A1I1F7I9_9GAMM|nr:flagellar protein FlhE [Kushneria avicenniae]SFB95345.1 protein FlhE [Kushneria avicenniae]
MNKKFWWHWSMMLTMLVSPIVWADAGGAVPIQVNLPDMAQKGWEYRVALPPIDSAPIDALITELSWDYDISSNGPVPGVWLCASRRCMTLDMARGSTDALAGVPVSTPLMLRFVLPGEGMLQRPVRGGQAQVFVHYRRLDP